MRTTRSATELPNGRVVLLDVVTAGDDPVVAERLRIADELDAVARELMSAQDAGLLGFALSDIASRIRAGHPLLDMFGRTGTIDVVPK